MDHEKAGPEAGLCIDRSLNCKYLAIERVRSGRSDYYITNDSLTFTRKLRQNAEAIIHSIVEGVRSSNRMKMNVTPQVYWNSIYKEQYAQARQGKTKGSNIDMHMYFALPCIIIDHYSTSAHKNYTSTYLYEYTDIIS